MNIKEITEYIFISDDNLTGDVALVFGTWNAWMESIETAAQLYHNKLVPKIIVSGGPNPTTSVVEGDLMARELERLGVPSSNVLVENKATNTLENVVFSIEIIDRDLGLHNIKTVVAVVKNYHARRALMTLRKQLPAHIKLKACTYASAKYNFNKDNWHDSKLGQQKVMGEVERINHYLAKGDLAEIQPQ